MSESQPFRAFLRAEAVTMAACSRAHLSQPVREKDGRRANSPTRLAREEGLLSPFVRNR